jgi:transposase
MRYELSDSEWAAIKPFLPNKSRGVRRVNDRRVLNGIFWVLRSGAPWRDLPVWYGPRTTCYNRFVRWRRAGVWGRIMDTQEFTQATHRPGCLGYDLGRSGEADAGRAKYATLLHHRLHFI